MLELPATGWLRRYRVRAHGRVDAGRARRARDGITIDGMHYGPIEATLDREQGANVWLTFAIREGKNREVKNVLGHLGLQVNRLIRVSFGPFQLGELAEGAVEEVHDASAARAARRAHRGLGGGGFLRADRSARGAARTRRLARAAEPRRGQTQAPPRRRRAPRSARARAAGEAGRLARRARTRRLARRATLMRIAIEGFLLLLFLGTFPVWSCLASSPVDFD